MTNLSVSYDVSTTADQATNIHEGVTTAVATSLHDTLNAFLDEQSTLNVTAYDLFLKFRKTSSARREMTTSAGIAMMN